LATPEGLDDAHLPAAVGAKSAHNTRNKRHRRGSGFVLVPHSRPLFIPQRTSGLRPSFRNVHGAASVTTALREHSPYRPTLQRSYRISDIRALRSTLNRASIIEPNYQQISPGNFANMLIEGGIFTPSFLRPKKKMISFVSIDPDGSHRQVCVVVSSEGNNGNTAHI
jgi:hypothetical protein